MSDPAPTGPGTAAKVAIGTAFVALPAAAGAGIGALVGGKSHRVLGAVVGGVLGGIFGGPLIVIAALSASPSSVP